MNEGGEKRVDFVSETLRHFYNLLTGERRPPMLRTLSSVKAESRNADSAVSGQRGKQHRYGFLLIIHCKHSISSQLLTDLIKKTIQVSCFIDSYRLITISCSTMQGRNVTEATFEFSTTLLISLTGWIREVYLMKLLTITNFTFLQSECWQPLLFSSTDTTRRADAELIFLPSGFPS